MDLVGRKSEWRALAYVVDAARTGPRTLLLRGEVGSGKTSLLDAAAERAGELGHQVLRAAGCAAESELSFATLHQLLAPVLRDPHGLDMLAGHLADAVRAACGVAAEPGPRDPVALRVGVLALLGALGARRPLLVIVDDVQLADRDSCDVLTFVLRRLTDERVSVLLAAGSARRPDSVEDRVPELELRPLGGAAAARLLDELPDPPSGRVRMEILQQAAGNPLALIELARAAAGGRPSVLPGRGLSPATRLVEFYADRLRELPEPTRRLLVYAAAAEQDDMATTLAAAGLTDPLAALAPAERAELVSVRSGGIAFRHPLVRAAAYEGAPLELRVRAHRDLAARMTDDPVRAAWHLAEAAVVPDEEVATALEHTAELARSRGGVYAAARALERAAECTSDPRRRAARYTRAITAADAFGDPVWVRELFDRVRELTTDPVVLAEASTGAAHALSLSGHQREAFALIRSALPDRARRFPGASLALASVLGAVRVQSGLPEHRALVAALAAELAAGPLPGPDDPGASLVPPPLAPALRENVLVQSDPVRHATRVLADPDSALHRPLDGPADLVRQLCLGSTAWFADESELAVECFRRVYSTLRPHGALGAIVMCLPAAIGAMIDTGRWGDAAQLIDDCADIAAVHRFRHLGADVAALRSELAALRAPTGTDPVPGPPPEAWTAVALGENRAGHVRLLRAAALAAASGGDVETGYRHLRGAFEPDGTPLHYFVSARTIVELSALAATAGERDDAAVVLHRMRDEYGEQGHRPTTRLRLLLHHAEALLGDPDAPEATERSYRLAVVDPAGEQWSRERALARLNYGRWLRRRRRPLEARPLLAAAHDTFHRLGAPRLADHAAAELRAAGSAAAPGPAGDLLSGLTAQQREVVLLAAEGLRNREIAERLFLSPRTVGSHLHNAYPKLGISGRHQLHQVIGS